MIKDGEIPRRNLPIKSIPSTTIVSPRSSVLLEKRANLVDIRKVIYKDYDVLVRRAKLIKCQGWSCDSSKDSYVKLTKSDNKHSVPQFEIFIDDSLGFTIRCYGWLLPETHLIYKKNFRSVRYITLSSLINCIENFTLCEGGTQCSPKNVKHVLPCEFELFNDDDQFDSTVSETIYYRAPDCDILCDEKKCKQCDNIEKVVTKKVVLNQIITPAKLNAPVSKTNPQKIRLTLQNQRKELKSLNERIIELKEELQEKSVNLSSNEK